MARRKKHRSKTRRRRVSGFGMKGALMKVAGIAAGVFAGRLITTKLAATVSPKISGAIVIGAGIFLPKYLKSDLGEGIGAGLVATGALAELQQFGVITGIGAMPPGQSANSITHNRYDPAKMRTVGAAPQRGVLNTAVNGMGKINVTKMGALIEES